MKCLLAVVLFAALVDVSKMDFINECMKELEINYDTDDLRMKCSTACLLKKHEYLVDGKMILDNMLKPLEEYKRNLTECIDKANKETDECDVANVLDKCMEKKIIFNY